MIIVAAKTKFEGNTNHFTYTLVITKQEITVTGKKIMLHRAIIISVQIFFKVKMPDIINKRELL